MAYTFDIDNGLPIKTWYEDKKDVELYKISGILKFLATTKDVRSFIRKFVKRNEIVYDEAMNIIKNFENKKIKINNYQDVLDNIMKEIEMVRKQRQIENDIFQKQIELLERNIMYNELFYLSVI